MLVSEVNSAIMKVAEEYKNDIKLLLTESDLKTSLVGEIKSRVTDSIAVNTESPWYDTYETMRTYFIDITAFDKNKLQLTYDSDTKRKGYRYDDEAIAIELKFFRYRDDIQEIETDFVKMRLLTKAPNNDCFIVAAARTKEIFETAKTFMQEQMELYRLEYDNRVSVYLFHQEALVQIL